MGILLAKYLAKRSQTGSPLTKQEFLKHFISAQKLPNSYIETAEKWFLPLIEELAQKQKTNNKQLVIGINGAQGSGKSTVSDLIVEALEKLHKLKACTLSIDDFYLTKAERHELAKTVHPMLETRGVPGTHDVELALDVLETLKQQKPLKLPRFHKALDDRAPECDFTPVDGTVDVVILEGWCVGAVPQQAEALEPAVNTLEANEDADGLWRKFVNKNLSESYQTLFSKLDVLIMLKAPSFDCVYNWRVEQETRLRAKLESEGKSTTALMDAAQIERFIQFYQRLTDHLIATLPEHSDYVFEMDSERKIHSEIRKNTNG